VTEEVKIWMEARSTSEGRELIRKAKQTIGPSPAPSGSPSVNSSSKSAASITIKSSTSSVLELSYTEDGMPSFITLRPNEPKELELTFKVNKSYSFEISRGGSVVSISRVFTKNEEWDLSIYFDR